MPCHARRWSRSATSTPRTKAKHRFPFIVCVRHYTKRGIFFEFARRLARDSETEFREDLVQIGAITRIRLDTMLAR